MDDPIIRLCRSSDPRPPPTQTRPPAAAARINARIASDPLLARLPRANVVQVVGYDDPRRPHRPGIADTSDRNWMPDLQRAWPYFTPWASANSGCFVIENLLRAAPQPPRTRHEAPAHPLSPNLRTPPSAQQAEK